MNKRIFLQTKTVIFILVVAVTMTFSFIPIPANAASKMKVEWFNVGAGDSMFIKFPNGKTALIDAGTTSKGYTIVNKLKKMHVNRINYVVSTHPDSDHCGGLQVVFQKLSVSNFYYPSDVAYNTQTAKAVIRYAKSETGCTMHAVAKGGQKIKGGNGAYMKFVQSARDYSTDNEDSIATFINYGKLQVLTCGDNEKGSEEAIEKHNVDILQLPHHGSKYATSMKFIKRFDPEYVVVSTDGHKYGHPNKSVFNICKKYDKKIKVWRTDKNGDIIVTATKKSWKINKKGVAVSKYTGKTKSSKPTSSKKKKSKKSGKKSSKYVYTTATGKKYHSRRSCPGLSHARKIYKTTVSNAKSQGLTKCKICY